MSFDPPNSSIKDAATRDAPARRMVVACLASLAMFVTAGCGASAPCEQAVDKQITLSKAEGSAAEKAMATQAETKAGAREGLIEVCSKLADGDAAFAARITCQAEAANLAAFKTCVNAQPQ